MAHEVFKPDPHDCASNCVLWRSQRLVGEQKIVFRYWGLTKRIVQCCNEYTDKDALQGEDLVPGLLATGSLQAPLVPGPAHCGRGAIWNSDSCQDPAEPSLSQFGITPRAAVVCATPLQSFLLFAPPVVFAQDLGGNHLNYKLVGGTRQLIYICDICHYNRAKIFHHKIYTKS